MKNKTFYHLWFALLIHILLSGCANYSGTFVDTEKGNQYPAQIAFDKPDGSKGTISATIDGQSYHGTWVYMKHAGFKATSFGGGNLSVNSGVNSSNYHINSLASGNLQSDAGNGVITMQGEQGGVIRCRFDWSESSGAGIGACNDADKRAYDLLLARE